MTDNAARAFVDIDHDEQGANFARRYLDAADKSAQTLQVRGLVKSKLGAVGTHGLDVGCGSGFVVDQLTREGFDVVGVDKSTELIAVARDRYPLRRFEVSDAGCLPFGDSSFDWYRSERMFLHLEDPVQALVEARRVLKPAGTIVLADTDFGSLIVGRQNSPMDETVFAALVDALPNGRAGALHGSWLTTAGFGAIATETESLDFDDFGLARTLFLDPAAEAAVKSGRIDSGRASTWIEAMREFATQGRFRLRCNFMVTSAVSISTMG